MLKVERYYRMREGGYTVKDIAILFGVTQQSVRSGIRYYKDEILSGKIIPLKQRRFNALFRKPSKQLMVAFRRAYHMPYEPGVSILDLKVDQYMLDYYIRLVEASVAHGYLDLECLLPLMEFKEVITGE